MNIPILTQFGSSEQSMTSLEISELVNSEHQHVRTSIERLAKRGVIQLPSMRKVENNQSLSPNKYTKCERFFCPADDGLKQEWTGTCWMNHPYGREIVDWVAKAAYTAKQGHTVVALVPVRTDARWFQNYCLGREIHFIKGRLKFGGSKSNAPFGCCVVVFRPTLNDVKWGAA